MGLVLCARIWYASVLLLSRMAALRVFPDSRNFLRDVNWCAVQLTHFKARVLNIVRVRTGEVRFFITELSMANLTPDQRRIVKRFAKDVMISSSSLVGCRPRSQKD